MNELNDIAKLAARYVNATGRHIFLTGKAGTGKTTFLKYIIQHTYKKAVVAAPTGVAAINAGGVTLHSLFQLPFGPFIPEDTSVYENAQSFNTPKTLLRDRKFSSAKRQLINELELLVIDEVSMLRADLLDCIDHTLRLLRKNNSPFGGIQILFIGDLMQLPPVIKDNESRLLQEYYESAYFFEAQALKSNPPIRVELQKIYRQSDQQFIDLLNRLRNNHQTTEDIELLNDHYQKNVDENEGYIYLTTHNHKANKINQQRLEKLEGQSFTFRAYVEGDFPENMYPVEENLVLKTGAQIMFLKNDPSGQGRFFNGKIGKISSLSDEEIIVEFEDGNEVSVEKFKWENKRFVLSKIRDEIIEKSLGSYEQFPIKLAWAVTIHKCQGLTFEKAILDLSDTFAAGQLYVALSRLTSLNGMILSSKISSEIPTIDSTLQSFVASFPDQSQLKESLENDQKTFIHQFASKIFGFDTILQELKSHERSFNKDEKRSIKQQFLPWTQTLLSDFIPMVNVGNGFIKQINALLQPVDYIKPLNERVQKAREYFQPKLTELNTRIKDHSKEIKKEKKTKNYLEELAVIQAMFEFQINQLIKFSMFVQQTSQNNLLSKEQFLESTIGKSASQSTKGKRKDKIPSAKITLEMYKDGRDIDQIAKSRGLVRGTIESHLTKYIASGDLDISLFVADHKIKKVMEHVEKGNLRGGDIKYELGDEFSYGEVRMVLAHARWLGSFNDS